MKIQSTKSGWTKTAKGEYTHVSKIRLVKSDSGWELVGGDRDGMSFRKLWVAMCTACETDFMITD